MLQAYSRGAALGCMFACSHIIQCTPSLAERCARHAQAALEYAQVWSDTKSSTQPTTVSTPASTAAGASAPPAETGDAPRESVRDERLLLDASAAAIVIARLTVPLGTARKIETKE